MKFEVTYQLKAKISSKSFRNRTFFFQPSGAGSSTETTSASLATESFDGVPFSVAICPLFEFPLVPALRCEKNTTRIKKGDTFVFIYFSLFSFSMYLSPQRPRKRREGNSAVRKSSIGLDSSLAVRR